MRRGSDLVAVLDYAINGSHISFTRAFTSPSERGNGYAAQVVDFATGEVEKDGTRRIIPMCWYVRDWFDAHPERAAALAQSVN
jgi:predicted GNAT family acetyltransferase